MSRRTRRGATTGQRLAGLALAVAIAAGLWYAWQHRDAPTSPRPASNATPAAPRVDAAPKPVPVDVDEVVRGATPLRDAQLGVSVAAGPLALVRTVEMLQWRERCADGRCEYAKVWSEAPIDSGAFRQPRGHENGGRFPFRSETFAAKALRAGALALDPAFAPQVPLASAASTPLAVNASQLPPNLAATFRERDGTLYAGDPARPAIGDLRVRYATLAPAGPQRLRGVRDGERLKPVPR